MADAIKDTFGFEAKLIAGRNGIFDVVADGRMIFSKHEKGRFPDHDEILDELDRLK